jgi:dipeptidyl aminopeptidase/acylaminoacyl peptidase
MPGSIRTRAVRSLVLLALLLPIAQAGVQAQDAPKPLSIAEYARWRSITSTALSEDGRWAAFAYRSHRADDTLYVKSLSDDRQFMVPLAGGAVFSDDGCWVAYLLATPFEEAQKLREGNKPVPRKAGLLDLGNGERREWENAESVGFAKGASHLVVAKSKPADQKDFEGRDLILRNLKEDYEELIGGVSQWAFNKPGTLLAWTVDAADKNGNGLYLMDLRAGLRRALDNAKSVYARLTWEEEGRAIAVLRGDTKKGFEQKENVLIAVVDPVGKKEKRYDFDPAKAAGFPDSTVVSEKRGLVWSDDLSRVFFGIKAQTREVEKVKLDRDLVADVDIWHWQDEQIQAEQKVRATAEKNRTHQAVWLLESGKSVQLTDERMRTIDLTRDGRWGIGADDRDYISDWKRPQADYYRVEVATGARTLILKGQGTVLGLSPDGKHWLYWQEGQVWDYVLEADRKVNLTAGAPVSFVNQEWDYIGEHPPYGVAGWTKDGKSVVLEHRYDLWLQPLDGKAATNLTGGTGQANEMVLRYVRTDPEERFIDLKQPLLLSAYGQWTKKEGFYVLQGGRLRELLYEDGHYGRVTKAVKAERYLFTRETWREYPDLWVSSGLFTDRRRITDANPQQAEFVWGRSILFDYTNKDGVRLQGWLGIPDTWRQGQKLPMLVQFYEKNSQNLHRYPAPGYRSSPNFAGYVSNGYLVMQPDVHFRGGTSHSDMLECVEAAVDKVIELGYADPARIGLHGHSYSGGGATFIATRSKKFAAITAGAAPIDLIFEFNILFAGSGQNNHQYDIHGQGRYGVSPYDDYELYESQSPIYKVQDMDTPLLYLHGAADPTVEYLMGIELYNACRFLGKPIIFLSYPGESHGLRREGNQIDFQTRMRAFFDHYLKGAPAPDWMVNGRAYLVKERELSRYQSTGGSVDRGGPGGPPPGL